MCTRLDSPWDSILEAVLTVSPNRQYRGIFNPTTPATTGPEWIPIRICVRVCVHLCRQHHIPYMCKWVGVCVWDAPLSVANICHLLLITGLTAKEPLRLSVGCSQQNLASTKLQNDQHTTCLMSCHTCLTYSHHLMYVGPLLDLVFYQMLEKYIRASTYNFVLPLYYCHGIFGSQLIFPFLHQVTNKIILSSK